MVSICSSTKASLASSGSCLISIARTMMTLFLRCNRLAWNAEETVSAKTSPQRKIQNQRRICWSIAPMALMLSIRCILGVKSSRSMIFMGDLWEELDKKLPNLFPILSTFHNFATINNPLWLNQNSK